MERADELEALRCRVRLQAELLRSMAQPRPHYIILEHQRAVVRRVVNQREGVIAGSKLLQLLRAPETALSSVHPEVAKRGLSPRNDVRFGANEPSMAVNSSAERLSGGKGGHQAGLGVAAESAGATANALLRPRRGPHLPAHPPAGSWQLSTAGRGRCCPSRAAVAAKALEEKVRQQNIEAERRESRRMAAQVRAATLLQRSWRASVARRSAALARKVLANVYSAVALTAPAQGQGGAKKRRRRPDHDHFLLDQAVALAAQEREELMAGVARALRRLRADVCRCGAALRVVDPRCAHPRACLQCCKMPETIGVVCCSKKCGMARCLPCGGQLLRAAVGQELTQQLCDLHLAALFDPG